MVEVHRAQRLLPRHRRGARHRARRALDGGLHRRGRPLRGGHLPAVAGLAEVEVLLRRVPPGREARQAAVRRDRRADPDGGPAGPAHQRVAAVRPDAGRQAQLHGRARAVPAAHRGAVLDRAAGGAGARPEQGRPRPVDFPLAAGRRSAARALSGPAGDGRGRCGGLLRPRRGDRGGDRPAAADPRAPCRADVRRAGRLGRGQVVLPARRAAAAAQARQRTLPGTSDGTAGAGGAQRPERPAAEPGGRPACHRRRHQPGRGAACAGRRPGRTVAAHRGRPRRGRGAAAGDQPHDRDPDRPGRGAVRRRRPGRGAAAAPPPGRAAAAGDECPCAARRGARPRHRARAADPHDPLGRAAAAAGGRHAAAPVAGAVQPAGDAGHRLPLGHRRPGRTPQRDGRAAEDRPRPGRAAGRRRARGGRAAAAGADAGVALPRVHHRGRHADRPGAVPGPGRHPRRHRHRGRPCAGAAGQRTGDPARAGGAGPAAEGAVPADRHGRPPTPARRAAAWRCASTCARGPASTRWSRAWSSSGCCWPTAAASAVPPRRWRWSRSRTRRCCGSGPCSSCGCASAPTT